MLGVKVPNQIGFLINFVNQKNILQRKLRLKFN